MKHMTKAAESKAKATKKCSKPRCSNDAASPRAQFCIGCFKKNAKSANLKRKVRGGGGGVIGNSGNTTSGHKKKNANLNRKVYGGGGLFGNSGNTSTGHKKAGKRSALRRSTKMLLVVKNPWLDLILSGKKIWEIRDAQTKQRGKIHLALSGAGGRIVGQCLIADSFAMDKGRLGKHFAKHCIEDLALITYRRPHAWVLSKARRYKKPFVYSHPQGAIKWVKL